MAALLRGCKPGIGIFHSRASSYASYSKKRMRFQKNKVQSRRIGLEHQHDER